MERPQSLMSLLQTSTEAFLWAIEQMPEEQLYQSPPNRPQEWPAVRHLLHLQFYEEHVALPNMRLWLSQDGTVDAYNREQIAHYQEYANLVHDEEEVWSHKPEVEQLVTAFRAGRVEQVNLLPQFSSTAWETMRRAVWGEVSLRWLVTKTYQHTAEHTHDVLRMALFRGGHPAPLRQIK